MKLTRKILALTVAVLALCMALTSCSGQREDTGVAYEKNMKIAKASDLTGKTVAVQLLSPADEYLTANNLTAYPRRYENLEKAMDDLLDKKVAAVIADRNYAKKLIEGREGVKVVDAAIAQLGYSFRFNEADSAIAQTFNRTIASYTADKTMSGLVEAELVNGKRYGESAGGEALKIKATLVVQKGLAPFSYMDGDEIAGFIPELAGMLMRENGMEPAFRAVYAGEIDEAMTAGEDDEHRFRVVVNAQAADGFVDTDTFYTSELVMIIRDEG